MTDKNIISHQNKYVYLLVPKVACTSIRYLIAKIEGLDWIQEEGRPPTTNFDFVKTSDVVNYPDYFKFSFVRNPWDRLVSCYFDKIKYRPCGIFKKSKKKLKNDGEFSDFVSLVCSLPNDESNIHFIPQCKIIDHKIMDFIGRFETIETDMSFVCNKLGIPSAATVSSS